MDLDGVTRDFVTDEVAGPPQTVQQADHDADYDVNPVLGTLHTANSYQLLQVNETARAGNPAPLPPLPELDQGRKGGYCRRWFVVKAAAGTPARTLQMPGVASLIVGRFENATAALVHKKERIRVNVTYGLSPDGGLRHHRFARQG